MIRYALKCAQGHSFDSWFQNAAAFDSLSTAGRLACPSCGTNEVTKSLMAPRVTTSDEASPAPLTETAGEDDGTEQQIAALKAKVEAEADYVGDTFAREARAIHDGDAPERAIYGEAKPKDALALIEDGVPIAPLPFMPTRKAN